MRRIRQQPASPPAEAPKKSRVVPVIAVLWLAFCSGCSSLVPEPIGIGPDRDELKQSPCACQEIQQDYSTWRTA